jgi:hypothetical protein
MPNSIETGRKVVARLTVPHDRISGGGFRTHPLLRASFSQEHRRDAGAMGEPSRDPTVGVGFRICLKTPRDAKIVARRIPEPTNLILRQQDFAMLP